MHITGSPDEPKLMKDAQTLKKLLENVIYYYSHIAVASPRRKYAVNPLW